MASQSVDINQNTNEKMHEIETKTMPGTEDLAYPESAPHPKIPNLSPPFGEKSVLDKTEANTKPIADPEPVTIAPNEATTEFAPVEPQFIDVLVAEQPADTMVYTNPPVETALGEPSFGMWS